MTIDTILLKSKILFTLNISYVIKYLKCSVDLFDKPIISSTNSPI